MKLWTIQPVEVYGEILEKGYYICDQSKAENAKDFADSYKWMVRQMDKRGISHPDNATSPVWAWHTYNWRQHQPDLREGGHGCRGEKSVCLELEVPDEEVLLSDFDEWCIVLNKWYIDDSTNEEEYDEFFEEFDKLPPKEQKILKEASWEKVFDLTEMNTEWRTRGRWIQATFWILKKEYIKNAKFFTCK